MSSTAGDSGAPDIPQVEETQSIWDAKADFWDERMGEGNAFHRELVGPAAERLLAVKPGETALDIACGNGQFARRMAELGADIVATDYSARFIDLARQRTAQRADIAERVTFRQVDATKDDQLLALGVHRFDAISCLMALMDMTTIEPLLGAIPRLLRPGGRFVFAIQHPCFNANGVRMLAEEEEREGAFMITHWLKISGYLTPTVGKGTGMPGEPVPHWYFHRPLSEVLSACFRHGMVMDGIEEPRLAQRDSAVPLTWFSYPDIPPVFAARMLAR